jgi:hypothetical protein
MEGDVWAVALLSPARGCGRSDEDATGLDDAEESVEGAKWCFGRLNSKEADNDAKSLTEVARLSLLLV